MGAAALNFALCVGIAAVGYNEESVLVFCAGLLGACVSVSQFAAAVGSLMREVDKEE